MDFFLKNRTTFPLRLIFISFIFLSLPLWSAQTILLKNGTSVKGDVTGQNENNITVRLEDGSVQTFSKKGILKVIYKDINEEEAKRIRQEEETKIREAKTAEEKKQIQEKSIFTQSEGKGLGQKNRWSLVWRSAVLPGWGHYKADRKKTGIAYGALFWGSLFLTMTAAKNVKNTKSEYENVSAAVQLLPSDQIPALRQWIVSGKRSEYKKSIDDYEKVATGTVLIYLIQLANSYFTGIIWEKEEIAVTPTGAILQKGIQLDSMRESNVFNSGSGSLGWRAEVRYNWFF
ncbi:LA_0442/LA_0875 N-terminal domain-containing protein [Leptospira alstonii]|uniref:DUF5683 domain-containing protein n=2 Tax=Leptospira alstonii TaxID=28452 RepID=M6CRV2_9LEPT|nr:hypothetical protein [Leptospira alstonii]EMJ93266.1 hypothetical protein LEP1GSC194_1820 [Leptospira alstonii serovar Sichuan str. 79601]EQA78414.1 hypothetical protein LEP1GSC193_4166 [Leptospira alstonii serovar Pingchang str. 80-412]